jgi:hypothetical protein
MKFLLLVFALVFFSCRRAKTGHGLKFANHLTSLCLTVIKFILGIIGDFYFFFPICFVYDEASSCHDNREFFMKRNLTSFFEDIP